MNRHVVPQAASLPYRRLPVGKSKNAYSLVLMRIVLSTAVVLAGLLVTGSGFEAAAQTPAPDPVRVYSHRLEPRDHPDDNRRAVKPPSWDTFGNRTHFTTLRGFNVERDRIVGFDKELDRFTRVHDLGDVIWPSYPILFAENLGDLADEIRRRDLFLFDVWGYVPGSGPGGYWQQFQPPAAALALLEARLGDRWLGTDIGEQDGRFIGGYADQSTPASASRASQYRTFQRHFERMGDDLGHKHATLVSLNFGHYLLKEGTYTLIGAETAQGLPNNQVYYSFIRGAGKQYGVPWFGNASVFNRWGYKSYAAPGRADGYDFGPTKGTSLSLLKRLLYTHILYNSVAVGFENGWIEGDKLTPIGRIQQAAQRWVRDNGAPGIQHTPVALLLDFHAGWSFPRHLYSDKVYRVWGNLPYEPGDYWTDAVLDLLYPGYQDASYYHDESGFIAPTPYGDIADVLLSDAPGWLLDRYALVVAAGELRGGRELADKLEAYVRRGGHLVLTASSLAHWPEGFAGLQSNPIRPWPVVTTEVRVRGGAFLAEKAFANGLSAPIPTGTVRAVASESAMPLAVDVAVGAGRLTVFASPFGLAEDLEPVKTAGGGIDQPLPKPYTLLGHVRSTLDALFKECMLFEAGPGLEWVTCRKGLGDYTLGLFNPGWQPRPFHIDSHCGPILDIREIPLDTSEIGAPGYTPESVDPARLGRTEVRGAEGTLAGGDLRLFAVRVQEDRINELAATRPPDRPRGCILPLREIASVQDEILSRPTLFQHYDGVWVDWRALDRLDLRACAAEAPWLRRQGVRIWVDASSGVNLYPALRLVDNLPAEYERSRQTFSNLFVKMQALGARDLVLSLHRHPENNFSAEQTQAAFEKTLKELAAEAAPHRIALHLRVALGKPPWGWAQAAQIVERVGEANLDLALATALLGADGTAPDQIPAAVRQRIGCWLVASPRRDLTGRLWDVHGPVRAWQKSETLRALLEMAPDAPLLVDSLPGNADDEYEEARFLAKVRPQPTPNKAVP